MWKSVEVAGHPVDVLEPEASRPPYALLYLHDQDGCTLRDDPALTELLFRHQIACLCPHGGQSWWSSRSCLPFDANQSAEQWLLNDVFPLFAQRWSLPPKAVALAGTGMGGQGALRLAFKHPDRFPIVAALNAAIDHHELYWEGTPLDDMYSSREHCRQDSAGLHIHPVRQPAHIWFGADSASRWHRGNDRLHEKLAALGVPHKFENESSDFSVMINAIAIALREESRRLL